MDNIDLNKLREKVHDTLDDMLNRFYEEVPYATHLRDSKNIDLDYHIRHTIEIILRLRMKRTIDGHTITYFTKTNPMLAKKWCNYTEDEMLHDMMFAKDLEAVGITKDEIYSTDPFLSTKFLQGYFYYGLEHEGRPFASLASSYFIEYLSVKALPSWNKNIAENIGIEKIRGSSAHVDHDIEDSHIDFVWDVIATFINSREDADHLLYHLNAIYILFRLFYIELYLRTVEKEANFSFDNYQQIKQRISA